MAGLEDAAVPAERLGQYLREFEQLLQTKGFEATVYGHFGDGCIHARMNFDFGTPATVATFRRFVEDAADLVVKHGGSLSGEHGDGQARGELLPRMFTPTIISAFEAFKVSFDPTHRLNPRARNPTTSLGQRSACSSGTGDRSRSVTLGSPCRSW